MWNYKGWKDTSYIYLFRYFGGFVSFRQNWVICLSFSRSPSNTDPEVARLVQRVVRERTGGKFDFDNVVATCIADVAAIGVAAHLGLEEKEGCGMHQGDKLGASATGKLLRSKNRTVINPFPSGMHVVWLLAPNE